MSVFPAALSKNKWRKRKKEEFYSFVDIVPQELDGYASLISRLFASFSFYGVNIFLGFQHIFWFHPWFLYMWISSIYVSCEKNSGVVSWLETHSVTLILRKVYVPLWWWFTHKMSHYNFILWKKLICFWFRFRKSSPEEPEVKVRN